MKKEEEDGYTLKKAEDEGLVRVKDGEEEDVTGGQIETDAEAAETEAFLRHYLNLGPNLGELYENWSAADANFKKRAPRFTGIRILRQDAWEALVGFICSSNNNIARISQMVSLHSLNFSSKHRNTLADLFGSNGKAGRLTTLLFLARLPFFLSFQTRLYSITFHRHLC